MSLNMLDIYNANMGGDAFKNYFELTFHGLPLGVGRVKGGFDDANTIRDMFSLNGAVTAVSGGVGSGADRYTGLVEGEPCFRTKSFNIPGSGVTTTDINFMARKYKVPVASVDINSEFNTELRIDRFWTTYQDLVLWRNKIADPYTGRVGFDSLDSIAASTISDTRCRSIVVTADAPAHSKVEGRPSVRWTFSLCFPSKLGDVAFDYTSGEPIVVNVTFAFKEMDEYFYKYDQDDLTHP